MIYVEPYDLSVFFFTCRKQLETNYIMIAEQDGREFYLTADNGLPRFHVEIDGKAVFDKIPEDCTQTNMEDTYTDIALKYGFDWVHPDDLSKMFVPPDAPDETSAPTDIIAVVHDATDDGDPILDEQAKDRQRRIMTATEDMLRVFLGADPAKYEVRTPDLEDLSYHIGRFLMDEWGISMNYPTAVVHADGSAEVLDFPFDDPNTEEVSE